MLADEHNSLPQSEVLLRPNFHRLLRRMSHAIAPAAQRMELSVLVLALENKRRTLRGSVNRKASAPLGKKVFPDFMKHS